MRPMLLIGVILFILGLGLAGIGMLGVGDDRAPVQTGASAVADEEPARSSWEFAIPVVSGLALATGALLVGLSFGNWRQPRTHAAPGDEVVDPEGHQKMKHV